jgi:glycosyltransferase involved in cell wall biosynthesis
MHDPFFSIVIPCYNGAKTLPAALDSVCSQTCKNFEVIVVNDGSTDLSRQIIESYKNRLPLKILNQNNAGLGAARNAGILHSTGEFISFLDADDIWFDKKLECCKKLILELNGNVDVVCHAEEMRRDGVSLGVLKHGPYTSYYDLLFKGNSLSPSATSVRRNILNEVGLFSLDALGHGAEDWDLWLKLAKRNARISYIKEVLGIYMLYGFNMSESPEFHKKCRYVFEMHVSKLHRITPFINMQINGARAIHELYAAKSYLNNSNYTKAASSALAGLTGGFLSSLFWRRIYSKIFSSANKIHY